MIQLYVKAAQPKAQCMVVYMFYSIYHHAYGWPPKYYRAWKLAAVSSSDSWAVNSFHKFHAEGQVNFILIGIFENFMFFVGQDFWFD